jgi:DNA-binding transcriptional ArsR family regulator
VTADSLSCLSPSGLPRSLACVRLRVTKHLRVLEEVGLVRSTREGREIRFEFTPAPLEQATKYLAEVSKQWDDALARLKTFVESA